MKVIALTIALLGAMCPLCNAGTPTVLSHQGVFLSSNTVELGGLFFGVWPGQVVIGNTPVFDACTVKISQKIVAWKKNDITIIVKPGTFKPGDVAYLFVVARSWWFIPLASGPYAVTFGVGPT